MTLGVELGFWRRSCDHIIASLEEFSQNLLDNLKRFREYGDKNRADELSSSCIASFAHLATLYDAVCRMDPVDREMHIRCESALQRLGMLTSELHLDEYTYLDLLLGVRLSLCCFLMMAAQMGDWNRNLGRNRCQSSTTA